MPCRPAISSQSLGRACEHTLFPKIKAASEAGFEGIEIFYGDLAYLADVYTQERLEDHGATEKTTEAHASAPSEGDFLRAAQDVRDWCTRFHLEIIALQPFQTYEGLESTSAQDGRLRLRLWLPLCHKLQTQIILLPSSPFPPTQLSEEAISTTLCKAADLDATERPPVKLAYDALAWGTLVDKWDYFWKEVQQANRENLGICIDTFNLAGRVYADPTSPDRRLFPADPTSPDRSLFPDEQEIEYSLDVLKKDLDMSQAFYVQVVNAEDMERPIVQVHAWYKKEQPARVTWSRNARLFAYEKGVYFPVRRMMEVLIKDCKYEGWVSMELFNMGLVDSSSSVPREYAERGIGSWKRLKEDFGL